MQVSREYAIDELKSARKTLSGWIKDLEKPTVLTADGGEAPAYPDGEGGHDVPPGLSVSNVEGIPTNQFRAELLALAGKLEALASGVSTLNV